MDESSDRQFQIDLSTPAGMEPGVVLLTFASLEAAYCDLVAAIPDTAAALLRTGTDPMRCAYVLRDAGGVTLMTVPFTELVRARPRPPRERTPRADPAHVDAILRWSAALRDEASATRERSDHVLETSRKACAASPVRYGRTGLD